jgi:putative RNA 2'-phosphotransferase
MTKDLIRMSKFLSLVLRHKPEAAGVTLDDNGWVNISTLLAGCRANGHAISHEEFDQIVRENEKKRFTVEGQRVRAAQGHSLDVDLQYKPVEPPELLYHGTVFTALDGIKQSGLKSQRRQHVHLSADTQTAETVGSRRGKPVIVVVSAQEAHKAGIKFYQADNGVWLADAVPYKFLKFAV